MHLMETLTFPAVGTCIKTRKDVPNFSTKLSKRGEAEFLVTKNGTMCARWLDSKEVMMLSNCHEAKYAQVNRTMKEGNFAKKNLSALWQSNSTTKTWEV
ncbi:rho guanine nucleotide exchange factor 10-like protein [Trichonephila clavata]|uniref:Rho guanine nucleotide exchange factor 10-like protein n=1 Tax=Trichonephila clavata TaxID=2740835 RepID=A0A8X6GZR5_TRICU|nr:rho guanine nucleotide exchange factor 10-like protein [Trichonephila clavata]